MAKANKDLTFLKNLTSSVIFSQNTLLFIPPIILRYLYPITSVQQL